MCFFVFFFISASDVNKRVLY